MAVRNLEGIQRKGRMIAEQNNNALILQLENFNRRVNIIKGLQQKCIDAVDTILALEANKIKIHFNSNDITFDHQRKSFETGDLKKGYVVYLPYENSVQFGWSDYGMCETYSAEKLHSANGNDYYVLKCIHSKDRSYDKNLTEMATKLEPFLDSFFEWVDSIE